MTTDPQALAAAIAEGYVPAHIYNDDAVFRLEVERLFGRAWVFLAHSSEIARPDDFVVRHIVDNSLLVTRDRSGEIHVLFNMCVHRGMQVCRAERGSAATFRCPYHAWTYFSDGRLAGVPFHDEAYGGDAGFVKEGQALLAAPKVAVRNGMIFASLDPDAPPLEDWLGDFGFYLDFYTGQTPAGMEFRGPQRWRIRSNWKIGAENFCGDSYHTPQTHASVVEIGLFGEPKANKRKEGVLYHAGPGGGTTYKLPPGQDFAESMAYVGYPPPVIEAFAARPQLDGLAQLIGRSGFMPSAATLFPNLSFVHNWPQVSASKVAPFISVRQWQPVGPAETEVLSWFAVAADAPAQFKRDSYKAYLMCFGSSGMFEQDDVENWVSITTTAGASLARRVLLNSRMGLRHDGTPLQPPYPDFAGPGHAVQGYGEQNQRHLLGLWAEAINRPAPQLPAVSFGSPAPEGAG
jgi:phenylpropionate dioxygenase-like ring-hydroxylating dioxygenase large terminal subunit